MRIGVIGAGAVGGAIAALLTRAGHDVEVTARGDHLEAIRQHGLQLSGAWGDYTAAVEAGTELTRGPELVILATKAQDAAASITQNSALLRGVPVLVVQNGLGAISESEPLLSGCDVVGGLAMWASSLTAPGRVEVTTAGHTYLGSANPDHDLPARYVAKILSEVMPVSVVANFVGAQWTKLVVNQINALPAITGLSAQAVIRNPQLRRILTASMQENVRVGIRSGIRFQTIDKLNDRRLRSFARSPLWLAQLLPLLLARKMGPIPNPGSTLQSIKRGQSTEIDFLNGAVVEAANRVGVPAPVNTLLVELVHQVEASGTFLSPADVVAKERAAR